MKVRDIMSRNVVRISADDTLWIVQEIMDLGRVRHLPVVSGGALVGVISQRDLFKASLSNVIGIAGEEHKTFLEGVKIGDVMARPPTSIGPDETVQEAARRMAERKIGCLPVVEAGRLIGIITETDLLRYFSAQLPDR